jgi:hypothetical protein
MLAMAKSKSDSGAVRMVGWNFDIPPAAARRFVEDMRAYHAEKSPHKREEIAARQAWLLNEHLPRGARRIRTNEVAEAFNLMKGTR